MAVSRKFTSTRSIGEILAEQGVITAADLAAARGDGSVADRDVVRVLYERGLVTSDDVARALAFRHGLTFVDLEDVVIAPNVRAIIDRKEQLAADIVPLEMTERALTLCVADPAAALELKLDLEQRVGRTVKLVVSSPERVRAAIRGKSHGIAGHDEESSGPELALEVAWKLFDKADQPQGDGVYGGKAVRLARDGCTIEGSLPTGDEMRLLTFRKLVMKLNLRLSGQDEPLRIVGIFKGKGEITREGRQRYDVAFDRLAPGDDQRLAAWLKTVSG